MTLNHPVPFGNETLTTSPLNPDKSDYPCKMREGVYDITLMNNMAVNEAIPLTFSGSASHGGGSCQIAVTLDKEPTVDSVFKIIQVYEGGCPTAQNGNDGSEDGDFNFTIPEGFPSGQASLAWVWYNKIGNREVYMNCAPITVTGGSESKEVFNSLPNLYLINLPPAECSTADTSDVTVPNPGKNVVKGASGIFKDVFGPGCAASAAAQTSGLSGYQTGSPSSNSTPAVSSSSAAATSAPVSYGGGSSSMVTVPSAPPSYSGGAASIPTISTVTPASSSVAVTSGANDTPTSYPTLTASSGAGIYGPGTATGIAAGTAASSSVAAPVASGSASGSTCSVDGAVVCNGPTQFGLCNHGSVVWQAVADGTSCSNGQIMKRSAFRHAHVRRHAQNGGFRHGA